MQKLSARWIDRRKRAATLAAVCLALAAFVAQTSAQRAIQSPGSFSENFDIRTDKSAASDAYLNRVGTRTPPPAVVALMRARAAGLARLRANLPVEVTENPQLGTPEIVDARIGRGFLTPPATDRVAAMRAFLSTYADAYGLTPAEVGSFNVVSNYENPAGNMSWVELEQVINGLPVFQATIRGGFTARGELARTTGPLASGLTAAALPTTPLLNAAQAVSGAAAHVGWTVPVEALVQKASENGRITFGRGPMADDAKASLLYFPLAPGSARLAWETEIWGNPDMFMIVIDALEGTVLFRKNLTNHEAAAPVRRIGLQQTGGKDYGLAVNENDSRNSSSVFATGPDTSGPAIDFLAQRSLLRTAGGGGGIEVDIPTVGQTVFFTLFVQYYGNGSTVLLPVQASLDGVPFCFGNISLSPGQTRINVSCASGWPATSGAHTVQWDVDYTSSFAEYDEGNNSAAKTFTPSTSTFDVVVTRAALKTATSGGIDVLDQPTIGDTEYPSADFQITGTGSAVAPSYRATVDGVTICSGNVFPAITPGTSSFTLTCGTGWVAIAGTHTLQWDFDYDAALSEKSEINNSLSRSFTPVSTVATQAATYVIYDDDSPAPLSPTNTLPGSGTQAAFISRTTKTLIGNEAPNTFNNLGWLKDGANTTDGNNVLAGPDRDFVDGVDAPVTGVNRVFDFTYNPQTDNPASSSYLNGEVVDTFYWTNVYHDRLYQLGFTEAARNFQNDNFGRGGLGGDRVHAQAQDFVGLNNANFSTPPDGTRGRMRMYIFSGPVPPRTSGIDHDVLLHELTHGLSNRLHNNASGLGTTMAAGMGEGWSDFYARALLSKADEDPNAVYTTGGWVTYLFGSSTFTDNYYYGIRRFPYAVKTNVGTNGKPHNPLTFADIDVNQLNTSDGAYPPAFSGPANEVHDIGEVWCMALLEVRARFINRLGFEIGNQRILQFVTDGMKLDPLNPTFLQSRDSILAAANAGGGTSSDIDDIWNGFATRGMGYSSRVVANTSAPSVVEAFDVPGAAPAGGTLITESIPNGWIDPGDAVTVSLCVTNLATSASTVSGTLLASGGVMSPSGAQSYGSIPSQGNVCRDFTFTSNATCGSTLVATLQTQESGGAVRNLTYQFQVGGSVPFFSENFDSATVPSLPAGWTTSTLSGTANLWVTNAASTASAPNQAFAANLTTTSDNVLVSPSIAVPAGPAAVSFRNLFSLEPFFDGGVLEISVGGGGFQDILNAGGSFITGGYTGTIPSLVNRQTWTGSSGSYITSAANLPASASGQNINLRWRNVSDSAVALSGWSIDNVSLYGFQCDALAKRRRGQIITN